MNARWAVSGRSVAGFSNVRVSLGRMQTVSEVCRHAAAGRIGRRIVSVCFSPMPSVTNMRAPSPSASAFTSNESVSAASFASFSSPCTGFASVTAPLAITSYVTAPSAPLRFESVTVAKNMSPGAANRGASGCITTFGATFACSAADPVALELYATAVTRTSPTNSPRSNEAKAFPSASKRQSFFQRLSGLKRRLGVGLMRRKRSPSAPPPVFAPPRFSFPSTIGSR